MHTVHTWFTLAGSPNNSGMKNLYSEQICWFCYPKSISVLNLTESKYTATLWSVALSKWAIQLPRYLGTNREEYTSSVKKDDLFHRLIRNPLRLLLDVKFQFLIFSRHLFGEYKINFDIVLENLCLPPCCKSVFTALRCSGWRWWQ